jgi:phage terminase small subunit
MSLNDTSEQEKTLTAKQRQAAQMLAEGNTAVQAAERIGVARVTMERWKKYPEFKAQVRQVEDEIYNESLNLLKKTAQGAISCLIRNMDAKVSPYVQVSAASKLLDMALEVHKTQELEDRLQTLEALLANSDVNPRGQ